MVHWSCNFNLALTKKSCNIVMVAIFHCSRGFDNHLIKQEIKQSDIKVSFVTNGLEIYIPFTINKHLVFIGSMQFMNSSLNKLIKNFTDIDYGY